MGGRETIYGGGSNWNKKSGSGKLLQRTRLRKEGLSQGGGGRPWATGYGEKGKRKGMVIQELGVL